MRWVYSGIIAFSMYSKIPMPRVLWTKEHMRYVMCFFPAVGLIVGAAAYLWGKAGSFLGIGNTLHTSVQMLIPVLLTGGIHLDGLLDTADALSSYQSRERRLEILKDSHSGAFAIITGAVYFISYFGFLSELKEPALPLYCLSFCLSRVLSGLSVATFPCAKESGLARTFADGADKKRTAFILMGEGILAAAILVWIQPVTGSCMLGTLLLVFLCYRRMSVKKFGGITGDLAGFFLQVSELAMLITLVAAHIGLNKIGVIL